MRDLAWGRLRAQFHFWSSSLSFTIGSTEDFTNHTYEDLKGESRNRKRKRLSEVVVVVLRSFSTVFDQCTKHLKKMAVSYSAGGCRKVMAMALWMADE